MTPDCHNADINEGGSAFPIPSDGKTHGTYPGMTLRDYFAALAMQALLSPNHPFGGHATESISRLAYEMADALVARKGVAK